MSQGYIPPLPTGHKRQVKSELSATHNHGKTPKNKRLTLFVLLAVGVIVITIGAVIAFSGNNKAPARNASTIVQNLVDAGLPIENIIAYNEQTDPNSLLGRPNGYTSKVSFADNRIEQYSLDPEGGTVEVFNSIADANTRNLYVSTFSGTLFGSYVFQSNNIIMRISHELTPAQAEEYNAALTSK